MKRWKKLATAFLVLGIIAGILVAVGKTTAASIIGYGLGITLALQVPFFARDAIVSTREFMIRRLHLKDDESEEA